MAATKKKVVIVGAGIGARLMVKELSSLSADSSIEIVVIQPNDFAEMPFTGPLTLSYPEQFSKCVTGQAIASVQTVYGVAVSVTDGTLVVKSLGDNKSQKIEFDYLISATGFSFPKFLSSPGQLFEEREKEVWEFNQAALSGGDIVVGGGGIIAVEMACNLCEIVNKRKVEESSFKGRVKLVTSGGALCPTYDKKYQILAKNRLDALGCEVLLNRKVTNHKEAHYSVSKASGSKPSQVKFDRFTCELTATNIPATSMEELGNVCLYIPSFIGKGCNDYLSSFSKECSKTTALLNPSTNKIILDKHMMSVVYPKLFALGGCAQTAELEPYLGVPKIEAQAKTIANNLKAIVKGGKLIVHEEGLKSLTNAAVIIMGHHSYASFVPEVMPFPFNYMCNTCGSPCSMLVPCLCVGVACNICDFGLCGSCCGSPEGSGVAAAIRKWTLGGYGGEFIGFNGIGKPMPPLEKRMNRV